MLDAPFRYFFWCNIYFGLPGVEIASLATRRQRVIRLAKRMIVDGRMPTPEEALDSLRERCLDELFIVDPDPT